MSELEIIGYADVTVGNEVVQQPIYNQEVISIGSGESHRVMSLSEYSEYMAELLVISEASVEPIPDIPMI